MKKILAGALVLASLGLTGCSTAANEAAPSQTSVATQATGLSVTNGWVRVSEYSDHVGGMTGVFATITNNTDADVTLIGGACDIADAVQVHEVVMVDGAMKMQEKAGGIVIPAGESVTLEPGGLHVMLMGLKQPLKKGEEIELTLHFEKAGDVTVKVPVGGVAANGN